MGVEEEGEGVGAIKRFSKMFCITEFFQNVSDDLFLYI